MWWRRLDGRPPDRVMRVFLTVFAVLNVAVMSLQVLPRTPSCRLATAFEGIDPPVPQRAANVRADCRAEQRERSEVVNVIAGFWVVMATGATVVIVRRRRRRNGPTDA